MARFRDSSEDDGGEAGVDMSPLIDCVFILLIFFIVTTTFVEETGVDVERPEAATASSLDKNSILIALEADGSVVHAGREIGVGGVQCRGQQCGQHALYEPATDEAQQERHRVNLCLVPHPGAWLPQSYPCRFSNSSRHSGSPSRSRYATASPSP